MNNWKFLVVMVVLILTIYLAFDFFRPIVDNSKETKDKIDSLNKAIMMIQEHQIKLDSTIAIFNNEIGSVDSNIKNIKRQKTIIKEIYHEKINNVSSFNNNQIDSFFSGRYGKW
jgi:septal ring factor EnvC (AmiA/AmiB activator)